MILKVSPHLPLGGLTPPCTITELPINVSDDALIPSMGRDSLKAEIDVVMEVAMVTIGEHVTGLDADVETANWELLHGRCRIMVMWKLEVDEEAF